MATLSKLVAREIERDAFLSEVLYSGVGNISAIAAILYDRLSSEIDPSVSISAIGMALRRYAKNTAPAEPSHKKFPKHIELSFRSGVFEMAMARDEKTYTALRKLNLSLARKPGEFLSIAEGSFEIVLFTNQRNKPAVLKALKGAKPTSIRDNLAFVTVNWPPVTKDIPGIYYLITKILARRKISIQSFHTIGAEMMIFIDEKDLQSASEALSRLLNNQF